jgi:hypothetical protein
VNLALSHRYPRSLKGTRADGDALDACGNNIILMSKVLLDDFTAALTF